jgi:glycosyltransferase involved in cell wall biosynthesis
MAAGCAPVVSDLGCFRDFVQDGKNGHFFDHRAPDPVGELANVLGQVAADLVYRDSLREFAWNTARAYRLEEIAARMVEDFRSVMEPRSNAGSYVTACLPP